jgi:D-alanyl-D-alanine carboxypeptidase
MFLGLRSLAAVLGFAGALLAHRAVHAGNELQREVESVLRGAKGLGNAVVGVSLRDCASGAELVNIRAAEPFIPASNMKVITTGAALLQLGPNWRFKTYLVLTPVGNAHRLTLVGSGDPALFDPKIAECGGVCHDFDATVGAWASALRARGITRIAELVMDARIFDDETIPSESRKWMSNVGRGSYAVPVFGINLGANVAMQIGGAPAGSKRGPELAPTTNPVTDGASALRKAFARHGVAIDAARAAGPGDTPRAAGSLLVEPILESPMLCVLRSANEQSANLYAEALAKRVGAAHANRPSPDRSGAGRPVREPGDAGFEPGSWDNAKVAIELLLQQVLGMTPDALRREFEFHDGSGLDDRNRVTPRLMTSWIRAFSTTEVPSGTMCIPAEFRETFITSLAAPGEGTFRKRFDDPRFRSAAVADAVEIFGKTGYIQGTCTLSGVVRLKRDPSRAISFAVWCNKVKDGGAGDCKVMQEDVVLAAINHLRRASTQPAAGSARTTVQAPTN